MTSRAPHAAQGTPGFRPAAGSPAPDRPSHRQTVCLLLALLLVAGATAVVSLIVRPDDARSFDMYGASVFLPDQTAPVAVDLATGRPTVRLVDANVQVGAARAEDVAVVPTADGTLLVNRRTGEFNLVASTGFVVKTDGGVTLPRRAGTTVAFGLAARHFSYVVRTGATGTSAYLVGTSTVQAVAGQATVRPRAFGTMSERVDTAPGATAVTGDDLWLLAGTGTDRTLRRLSLRADSAPGSRLAGRDVTDVAGPAALATGGGDPAAPGAAAVLGVASGDGVSLYRGESRIETAAFDSPDGLDRVVAATSGGPRLAWLLHGDAGWSLLSIGADGTGLIGPTPLRGLDPDAGLVPPATSEGMLYSADARDGGLVRIATNGDTERVAGMPTYPVAWQGGRPIETADFTDTSVLARGPRVIVNSPNHLFAVAVFTDGSRAPARIEKSSAINVNGGGGAEALARDRVADDPHPTRTPRGKAQPQQPVNGAVDCRTTSQTPHIPAFGQPVPGSRSVELSWTYPVTDRSDCVPTTYVVDTEALSDGAPSPPGPLTVQGQQGVNLDGLYPSTRYRLTVTAYLNGKGTKSEPIEITTGPEGPAAPRDVAVAVDPSGAWTVDWRSCGSEDDGCVPAASWRIVPQFCDGTGLDAAPDAIVVGADPTSRVQPGARLAADSGLLGRALRFQVLGIGADGAVGAPSAGSACLRSWTAPQPSALRLVASRPVDATSGGTTSTTLSLSLGSDPVRAVGGVGATVTFSLAGPGGTSTRTVTVDGATSTLTTTFDAVRPGADYSATARVSPPEHPEAAVVVAAGAITGRASWPALSLDASCGDATLLTCRLSVAVRGLTSATAGAERFSLAGGSALVCDNASLPLDATGFDPAGGPVVTAVASQLANLYGRCTVRVALVEARGTPSPLYYGGTVSPTVTTPVALGPPATADLTADDFTAAWTDAGPASLVYRGRNQDAVAPGSVTGQVLAPNGTECADIVRLDTGVLVDAGSCVASFGDQTTGWQVRVTYADRIGGDVHTVDVPLPGAPKSYQACTPAGVSAQWSGTADAPSVTVTVGGELSGCADSGWTYELKAPDTTGCGTAGGTPPATILVSTDCTATPSTGDWRVVVGWTRPDGTTRTSDPAAVDGDPPA